MNRKLPFSSTRAYMRASVLYLITAALISWSGSLTFAQTAEEQAAFRNYTQLCSQVRKGTWEMRTTLCAMLEDDQAIVKMMIAAQVQDVCKNVDRECATASEDARGRLRLFSSTLKCPAGTSICTKETRTATLIDAKASGIMPPLKQPTDMTCWATVATMMYSWKNNRTESIESALGKVGSKYLSMFKKNEGLSGEDKPGFLAAMGLKAEAPQNYTAQGWANLIQRYGALWVTTNEGTLKNWAIHARIMWAIFGDGTLNGTSVVIYDPADGKVHTESLGTFVKKFELLAAGTVQQFPSADLRPQVVHY